MEHLTSVEATGLAEEDPMWVWRSDNDGNKLFIVASGYCDEPYPTCPIWGDQLGYKDVTVVVPAMAMSEAVFSLEYNHGAECVTRTKLVKDGMVAIRSAYQCW